LVVVQIPVSCNAYLADITDDPELLTIRSGVFSIAQTLAQVIGGVAAALCYGMLIAIAVDIELLMYLLAFFYTMWRIPQKPATRFELEKRRGNFGGTRIGILIARANVDLQLTRPLVQFVPIIGLTHALGLNPGCRSFLAPPCRFSLVFSPVLPSGIVNVRGRRLRMPLTRGINALAPYYRSYVTEGVWQGSRF
jgi:hypothetical protein